MDTSARERILSTRGLADAARRLRTSEQELGSDAPDRRERAMRRYATADADHTRLGNAA